MLSERCHDSHEQNVEIGSRFDESRKRVYENVLPLCGIDLANRAHEEGIFRKAEIPTELSAVTLSNLTCGVLACRVRYCPRGDPLQIG
jgi:hypothetical protein